MKILKAANPGAKKFSIREIAQKIGKRNLVITGSVLAVALIVTLNIVLLPKPAKNGDVPASAAAEAEDFFAVSAVNRSRARDEAMEVLRTVVDSGASEKAAAEALADISRIAADIEKEANIESLILAKGFEDCIAVISGEGISIVVKSDELLPNEIAQIKEIAYESAAILPENVVIIPKT